MTDEGGLSVVIPNVMSLGLVLPPSIEYCRYNVGAPSASSRMSWMRRQKRALLSQDVAAIVLERNYVC